jgi:outer membrane protein assembly factor BamB
MFSARQYILNILTATGTAAHRKRCKLPGGSIVKRMGCFGQFAVILLIGQFLAGDSVQVRAEDWPGWMGSRRDGVYRGDGLVDQIPEEGLPILWRTPIAGGYSGPAVVGDRVLVTDFVAENPDLNNDPGSRDVRLGTERVLCLDFTTGKILWTVETKRQYNVSYAAGPRATPTIDGNFVYTLGAEGDLHCIDLSSGEVLWHRRLPEDFGAETPLWGHAAHPLVYQNLIFCMAGGPDSAVVALDKMTGKVVWQSLTASEIGYCPPTLASLGGRTDLLIWHADAICGLDPLSGDLRWQFPLAPKYAMSICAPRIQGSRMYACGIDDTAAMIEFDSEGLPLAALWTGQPKKAVYGANATPLWIDDVIYGADCQTGQFIAVDPENGQRFWETFSLTTGGQRRASHGTAFMVQNDWRSFIFAETGELILARLSREGFEERGRMKVLQPTGECFGRAVVWSHPAFARRCMVVRNDEEIVCVSLADGTSRP